MTAVGQQKADRAVVPDPVPAPSGRPVIFYAPHQDDETLFMGQVIAHHALAGREVHVVLCSTGAGSAALDAINGVTANTWWGRHYPAREGYEPITEAEFTAARDREFVTACGQLGVQPANAHFAAGRGDTIGQAWAEDLIASWDDLYPDAGHYTMWWADTHPDHAALGAALRALRLGDPSRFGDARWLVRSAQVPAAGASEYVLPPTQAAAIRRMAIRAAWSYRAWAPRSGAYAIGYHSVSPLFAAVEKGDPNWIVKP